MSPRDQEVSGASKLRQTELPGVTLTEGIHRGGSTLPWHSHEGASICLVLDGAFVEYSRGRALDCRQSSLKFTPPRERHWNRFSRGDVRGLLVEVDLLRHPSIAPFERILCESLQFHAGPELSLARRLYSESRARDSAAPLAMEGLLLELLALVARRRETTADRNRHPGWARQAFDLLHAHRGSSLTLSEVASALGVHPATLARGFRGVYGCTVGQVQRQIRLEYAARQLVETDLPLTAIADQAGFYDQSHFTNAFRRHIGMPPFRYRFAMRG